MAQRLEVKLLHGGETIVEFEGEIVISKESPENPVRITNVKLGHEFVRSYQPFNGIHDLYFKLDKQGQEILPHNYQIQIKSEPEKY